MQRTAQGSFLESGADVARRKAAKEADVHPCPTCGLIQPDMIARPAYHWHGIITTLAFLAFIVLAIIGSNPEAVWADTAALVGAAVAALSLGGHVYFAFRNPNRDRSSNRRRADDEVARGDVEVICPGSPGDAESPPPCSSLACRVLAVVAAGIAIFVFLNQRSVMRSLPAPQKEAVPATSAQAAGKHPNPPPAQLASTPMTPPELEYWTAWGLATGVGSFGSVAGGLALCLLAVTLSYRARPSELIAIERTAKPAAPTQPTTQPSPANAITVAPISANPKRSVARLPAGPLPYFHAKFYSTWTTNQTIYRVYFTNTDLLFVHLGIATLDPEESLRQSTYVPGGGAVSALILAAVNSFVAAAGRERLDRLNKALAAADEEILRKFVEGDEESFALSFEEMRDVRLEEKTFWASMMCRHLVAFLKFTSASRGDLTLALISIHDMPTLAEQLRRAFGDVPCDVTF
jgi:hypothetical protein